MQPPTIAESQKGIPEENAGQQMWRDRSWRPLQDDNLFPLKTWLKIMEGRRASLPPALLWRAKVFRYSVIVMQWH